MVDEKFDSVFENKNKVASDFDNIFNAPKNEEEKANVDKPATNDNWFNQPQGGTAGTTSNTGGFGISARITLFY